MFKRATQLGTWFVYFLSSLRAQTAKTLVRTKSGVPADSRIGTISTPITKLALPPPASKEPLTPPPLNGGILCAWGFSSRKKMPGAHKIGAAISGPRIAGGNFMDITLFLTERMPKSVFVPFLVLLSQFLCFFSPSFSLFPAVSWHLGTPKHPTKWGYRHFWLYFWRMFALFFFLCKKGGFPHFWHSFWNRRKPHLLCRSMFLPFLSLRLDRKYTTLGCRLRLKFSLCNDITRLSLGV